MSYFTCYKFNQFGDTYTQPPAEQPAKTERYNRSMDGGHKLGLIFMALGNIHRSDTSIIA